MTRRRSIFYLDDEAACLDIFQDIFGEDYDVRTATTPAEARRMLAEQSAEIVISDQRMPEISGTDFLREVAELYPSSYRIILTGSVMASDIMDEINARIVNLFVAKPWSEDQMRQNLERASTSYELRSKARQAKKITTRAKSLRRSLRSKSKILER